MFSRCLGRELRLSIRVTLLVFVVLPLLVSWIVLVGLALTGLEYEGRKRLQEEVELVARSIHGPLGRAVAMRREGTVENILQSVSDIGRVYGIYVYGTDGQLLASSGETQRLPSSSYVRAIAATGDQAGEFNRVAGTRVYSYFIPLSANSADGEIINGLLHVTRRARDFDHYLASLRWKALLLTALGIASGLLFVLFGHSRAVGEPIRRLAESMAKVEDGDRGHRASVTGPREIGSLSRAMNRMLDAIHRSEAEVALRREEETRLHDELRRRVRMASIGRAAATVAHELGSPLSVIDGHAQRAMRKDEGKALAPVFHDIRNEVERMTRVIRELLSVSGKNNAVRYRIDLADVALAAGTSLQAEEKRLGSEIILHEPERRVTMIADPVRLELSLRNLLHNAMQAGGPRPVELRWRRRNGGVSVEVLDKGPGMPTEVREHLFEPFFSTKPVGEGHGLGLAIVKDVVDEYEGEVMFENRPEGGLRVVLFFPDSGVSDDVPDKGLPDDARTQ